MPLFPYLRLRLLFFSPEGVSPCFWQEDGSAWEGLLLIGISYGGVPNVFFLGFLRSSVRLSILVGYEDDFLGFFFPYRLLTPIFLHSLYIQWGTLAFRVSSVLVSPLVPSWILGSLSCCA